MDLEELSGLAVSEIGFTDKKWEALKMGCVVRAIRLGVFWWFNMYNRMG